jgi:hypothetical protein
MSTLTHDRQECVDICNSLLRGEIAAVETYNDAIRRFQVESRAIVTLEEIRKDHVESVTQLRDNVRAMGGMPDRVSGAWGTLAKTVQNAANLFGENSAMTALQQGEAHGRDVYRNALENEHVMPECKSMIRHDLLPKVERHIAQLDSLKTEH